MLFVTCVSLATAGSLGERDREREIKGERERVWSNIFVSSYKVNIEEVLRKHLILSVDKSLLLIVSQNNGSAEIFLALICHHGKLRQIKN